MVDISEILEKDEVKDKSPVISLLDNRDSPQKSTDCISDDAPPVLSPQADIPMAVDTVEEEEEVVHDLPTTTKNLEELMKMVTKISDEIQDDAASNQVPPILKNCNNGKGEDDPLNTSREDETSLAVKSLIAAESTPAANEDDSTIVG